MFTRLAFLTLFTAVAASAQGRKEDFDRAFSLGSRTANTLRQVRVEPQWQGDSFWYRAKSGKDEHSFVFVDCVKGSRGPAFDHGKLAAALGDVLRKPVDALRLPVERLVVDVAGNRVRFSAEGKRWEFARDTGALREVPDDAPLEVAVTDLKPRPSRILNDAAETHIVFENRTAGPVELVWLDAKSARRSYGKVKPGESHRQQTFAGHVWLAEGAGGVVLGVYEGRAEEQRAVVVERKPEVAPAPRKKETEERSPWKPFVREFNVWVKNRESGEEVQLSRDGSKEDAFSEPLLVSPDGRRLVAMQVKPEQKHTVYFVESSPKGQAQPKLHEHQYLKPGDAIRVERPRLFDLEKRAPMALDESLFRNPWDVSEVRWMDAGRFTFVYNERGHQVLRIVNVTADGVATTLVEDRSGTFVDYSQKHVHRWLERSGDLLWSSERDGWHHLYLFDGKSGAMKSQLTKGEWNFRGIERVDEEKRQVWVRVSGAIPAQDPYYLHLARVNFDGTGFTLLTGGDGTREETRNGLATTISPNGKWLLDTFSRVDLPPVTEVRNTETGALVCEIERANAEATLAAGWTMPERFAAKGRDGKTDIYGIIIRPSNFDAAKKYPVIEEIYAGPHGAFVPKAWGSQTRQHSIAELGFVVVQIDGMGTNFRGKAFHDVAWRNLKDAGFPDRIAWMKAAATTRPWMDLSRVGIYGGSAGGQNALAGLLHYGGFYKVGVADCGCHDNRMDKIWWNEAWLGEVGPWYEENSNVTHAAKLTGKLMLIVGEVDTNVDPASTMQVANALIKADKDFDLLVMPSTNHGAAETPYASRRRMDFFVRHLFGVEPRSR